MHKFDVTILTTQAYIKPKQVDGYIQNILTEDRLVQEALETKGLKVARVSWDDPSFDWSATKAVLFRTIWDYFERFDEFEPWLEQVGKQTETINPIELIWWNIDKHYLQDLEQWGINIVPTMFLEKGEDRSLEGLIKVLGWQNVILKPAISGTARHTYKIDEGNVKPHEEIFSKLVAKEAMLLQPFMNNILTEGEVSYMVFNGNYSHSILKKAKQGDFRVQDDFGGSVQRYQASEEEVRFAESVISSCKIKPLYARVDVVRDNHHELAIAELEVIEPELWFRHRPEAAIDLAEGLVNYLNEEVNPS